MESAFIFGGNAGAAPVDGLSWANLPGGNAVAAWDFLTGEAVWSSAYIGALSNTPNWTFTRDSTGYDLSPGGVLVPNSSGALRGVGRRGAYTEGAGTNLCLQSQTLDNASWSKSNVTVTADQAAAPDGTTTADKIEVTSTAATTLYQQNITATSTAATASIYVKNGNLGASDCDDFLIRNVTTSTTIAGGKFDWTTGVFTASAGGTVAVTSLANGWYRIAISISSGITASDNLRFWVGCAGNTETAGGYFYAWGAQLEATAFASSYIPTTTASATRAADSLSVTGVTGLDFPLTLFCEFERAVDTGANEALFAVDAGSDNERVMVLVEAADRFSGNQRAASTDVAAEIVTGALAVGTVYKGATRFALNDVKSARGGTLSTGDTSAAVPSTPTTIRIGSQISSANPCYGYLRRLAIYSRALTDAELQAVTT